MTEIVIGTKNRNKAGEIAAILPKLNLKFLTLADFPRVPDVPEDGKTLEENAVKKAVAFAKALDRWAFADDTGLEVDFLNGAPGVLSARYSGLAHDYAKNNEKLLRELEGVPVEKRAARFRCVVALASPEGKVIAEEGRLEGCIAEAMRGTNGFGYDPLFYVPRLGKTLAELSFEEKNALSHRSEAIRKMLPHLKRIERLKNSKIKRF